MPSSSFQATFFDYLRVIFHRIYWIILLVFLSVFIAWVWVGHLTPKRYKSEMTIMVWSRDMDNPLVKRMVEQAPLKQVIDTIRSKLKVDKSLMSAACNLRYAVKQEYIRELEQKNPREFARLLEIPLYAHLAPFADKGRDFAFGPGSTLERIPMSGRLYEIGSENVDLLGLANCLDTQSLVRIAAGLKGGDAYDSGSNMIWDEEDKGNIYIKTLIESFPVEGKVTTFREARKAAVESLYKRLVVEAKTPGAGGFDADASRELTKEILATNRLIQVKLRTVCYAFAMNDPLRYWVRKLKDGLKVSPIQGNLMSIEYEGYLYHTQRPYLTEDDPRTNLISHIVLRVAYTMIEGEFRNTERLQWDDTISLVRQKRDALSAELDSINKDLYDFEKLKELQLSFIDRKPEVYEQNPKRSEDPYWAEDFLGLPQASTHIERIDEFTKKLQIIDQSISRLEGQKKNLEQQIANPQERWIEIRQTVRKEDPPEVQALRGQLVLKELELRKQLERNTMQHPFVKNLEKEIKQIQAALSRHNTSPTVEEIERTENPRVREWKASLNETVNELESIRKERAYVVKLIEQENKKAVDAMAKQREYQDKHRRQGDLRKKLTEAEREMELLLEKRKMSQSFEVTFEKYTDAFKPLMHHTPQEKLVLAMALLIGMVSAAGAVFLMEYTDHSVKTVDDVKRYLGLPVLGTIPEFDFADRETGERILKKLSLFGSRRRFEIFPVPIDEKTPEPAHMRSKMRSIKKWKQNLILAFCLLLLVGVILWLMGYLDPYAGKLKRMLGVGPKTESVENMKPESTVDMDKKTGDVK
ncbi:MAG: hypothetical protein JXR97_10245 [Planctomycetes bacterium]|nr:hypothetical protein [Planctomycetota bacterium]